MRGYTGKHGITLDFSPPYVRQSNVSSEQLIQELWKIARTFIFESGMSEYSWAEAISDASWLRNRLPAHKIDLQVPYTLWHGTKPDMSPLLRFGQPEYAFQRSDTVKGK